MSTQAVKITEWLLVKLDAGDYGSYWWLSRFLLRSVGTQNRKDHFWISLGLNLNIFFIPFSFVTSQKMLALFSKYGGKYEGI